MADGKGNYGTVHVMEEAMKEAGQGVFEPKAAKSKAKPAKVRSDEGKAAE